MLGLQGIYEGTSEFTEDEICEIEIEIEAPDLIPNCVAAILLTSRPGLVMKAENLSRAPIPSRHPGINGPCPCGSGQK